MALYNPYGSGQQSRTYQPPTLSRLLTSSSGSGLYSPQQLSDFGITPFTSFGGQGGGPGDDNGVVSLPGGPVQPKGTQVAPPIGSPQSGPQAGAGTASGGSGSGTGGGGTGPIDFSKIDFSGDPILARIRAFGQQQIQDAQSAALAGTKQGLINYGYDPALASLYPDQTTAEAARQNPFSALAQLLFNHGERTHQMDEGLNKANLFYSGYRGKQLGLEGREYQLEQTNAASALQRLLGGFDQSVLGAKRNAAQQELQGMESAYDRAIQFALANNTGLPGGGGSGGGGGGGGPSDDFIYGATLQGGRSANDYWTAAVNGAPRGATPLHIMNQGMIQNGSVSIKYRMPDGTTNTIWVPLPSSQPAPAAAPPPPRPPATTTTAPTTFAAPSGARAATLLAGGGYRAPQ